MFWFKFAVSQACKMFIYFKTFSISKRFSEGSELLYHKIMFQFIVHWNTWYCVKFSILNCLVQLLVHNNDSNNNNNNNNNNNTHVVKQYTWSNRNALKNDNPIHRRPTTVGSNAHRKSNTRGRKYCTYFLILLLHMYCTPVFTWPSLHFTPISTLHGTPRFTPFTALPFNSLHFTPRRTLHGTPRFTPFTALPLNSLHFTPISTFTVRPDLPPSLHYPSIHFTSLFGNFNTHFLQFTTLITFLTLFLKAFSLQGRIPKISAGNRFHSRMVLFTVVFLFSIR